MSADFPSPESSAGARGSALPSNNNGASTKESAVGSGRRLLTNNTLFGKEIIGAADGDIWFVEVKKKVADELIVGHHYSRKATSNSFCSVLINGGKGAIQLGYGIRPKLKGALADLCQDGTWCEFDRMWLHDDLPKFSESRVIGLLLFYIKHRFPKLKFVITYADESAGNSGTIYRATNAVEIDGKEVDFYLLANGERLHPVTAWHRHGTRTFAKLAETYPGIIRIRGDNVQGDATKEKLDSLRGKRQRKYIYALDKKSKKRLAIAMGGWGGGAGVGKTVAVKPKAPNVGTEVETERVKTKPEDRKP
jgi:hypothetical protein